MNLKYNKHIVLLVIFVLLFSFLSYIGTHLNIEKTYKMKKDYVLDDFGQYTVTQIELGNVTLYNPNYFTIIVDPKDKFHFFCYTEGLSYFTFYHNNSESVMNLTLPPRSSVNFSLVAYVDSEQLYYYAKDLPEGFVTTTYIYSSNGISDYLKSKNLEKTNCENIDTSYSVGKVNLVFNFSDDELADKNSSIYIFNKYEENPNSCSGVQVYRVASGGPSSNAGVEVGEIILELNNEHIDNFLEFNEVLYSINDVGNTIYLKTNKTEYNITSIYHEDYPNGYIGLTWGPIC